jgi:uncharacterized membrane protein
MSLKLFHLFFIGTCILLAVVVASWAMFNAEWLTALVAVAGGAVLIAYREAFLYKSDAIDLR